MPGHTTGFATVTPLQPVNGGGSSFGVNATLPDIQPHHGLVAVVLVAVVAVYLLDRLGFRFAVTVGRR